MCVSVCVCVCVVPTSSCEFYSPRGMLGISMKLMQKQMHQTYSLPNKVASSDSPVNQMLLIIIPVIFSGNAFQHVFQVDEFYNSVFSH